MGNISHQTPGSKLLDNHSQFCNETQIVFEYLQTHTATASMVSEATGIKQKNICRYKRDLEKRNLLWEISKKTCKVTGFKAWYLTTNPKKVSSSETTQFKLML